MSARLLALKKSLWIMTRQENLWLKRKNVLVNYPEQVIVDQESPGETVNLVVKDMMERDSNGSGDLE